MRSQVRALHGPVGAWGDGDCNGDGQVTFLDYQILEQHFGSSVPEPAAVTVICAAALPLLSKRRRQWQG